MNNMRSCIDKIKQVLISYEKRVQTEEQAQEAREARRELHMLCSLIYEEVQKVKTASKWQPIETAPKDGKWILGYYLGIGVEIIYFDEENERFEKAMSVIECSEPTHWMPLPEPPKEKDDE